IFNRALSSNEVSAIYAAGVAGMCLSSPPSVAVQPQSQTVTAGSNASFSVSAGGTPPLSYQWTFNGTSLPGGTAASLTLTNVQTANAGYYQVRVSNVFGSVLSAVANLSVVGPLTNGAGIVAAPGGMVNWWPAEGNAND